MFVINLTKKDLVFRAHGEVLTLKSGLNKVDDKVFSEGELKNHFGCNVTFITDKDVEETKGNIEAPKPIAPKVEEKKEEVIVEKQDKENTKSNKASKAKAHKSNKK